MRAPRVLLLGDTLAAGGTEGQFVEVALGLRRTRWDVRVACLRPEGPLRARLDAAGIQVVSLGRRALRTLSGPMEVLGLARWLRRERIDVVHTFDYYSNVRGVLAARLARTAAVVASQRDLGNLRPLRQERLQRAALRLAHRVLVNSPAVAEVVRDVAGVPPERVVLVANGVDLQRFRPHPQSRSTDRVVVGTLANLRPEKGVAELVEAAALVRERCPEARLVIWGDGPLRRELASRIATLGLAGTAELRGPTATPEAALRELDIFVLASTSEASSNALLEAMATGLPVVATSMGGNPWMVEDERTGLLAPAGDVTGLAQAILRVVEDPILRRQLGTGGRARVETQFTVERMIESIEALYRETLGATT